MIRLDTKIRLTRREAERFVLITDIAPDTPRTIDGLGDCIERCKRHCWGESHETRFLHWLLDREYRRCVESTPPLEENLTPAGGH